jgi:release factor glutamine methyltransferase
MEPEFNTPQNATEATPAPWHPQVYQPEADTMLLLEAAIHEVHPGETVLEIGTGSGYIALQVSSITRCYATDINPHACRTARTQGVEVIRTDLASGICHRFDVILFNPPYLPTSEGERMDDWLEYALDGGEDGRDAIRRFAEILPGIIAPIGRALLLISECTGIDEVREIFGSQGFLTFIVAETITEGERLVVLRIMHDLCSMSGGMRA